MREIIDSAISNKINCADILKREIGIVNELLDDGLRAKVKVNDSVLSFLNKCGEELSVGDEVEINYWTNIGNGYIAVKHGLPTPMGTGARIDNAVVTYDGTSDYDFVDNLYNVELENDKTVRYALGAWNMSDSLWNSGGITYNRIYVNGYAATYIPQVILNNIDNKQTYSDYIKGINSEVYYKQVVLPYYSKGYSAFSENFVRYITYYIGLYDATYENGTWKYRYALYESDPDRTGFNDQQESISEPVYRAIIISDTFTSKDNVALDDVNFLLLYPGHFNQYEYSVEDSKTYYLDKLEIYVEPVLIIKDNVYFYTRYSSSSDSPYIGAYSTEKGEIECIKAKVSIAESTVA